MQTRAESPGKSQAKIQFDRFERAALCRNSLLSIEYESQEFDVYAEMPSSWLRVIHQGYKVANSAFITAYNPYKEEFHLHANLARQHWLRSKVERQWAFLEGSGCNLQSGIDRNSPCPVEAQLLVLGISLEEALALAIEYGQPSVLYNEADGVPRFYHCESGECLSPPEDDPYIETTLADIELAFRPATYWPSSLTPHKFIAQLPCKALQQEALKAFEFGGLSDLQKYIAQCQSKHAGDPCSLAARAISVDYSFPPAQPASEVVIASFSLRSVHSDEIWVIAQWGGEQIRYAIRNDFDMIYTLAFTESESPLTLQQLIVLIDGSDIPDDIYGGEGIVQSNWKAGFEGENCIKKALRFISIESSYYPQLATYYGIASEDWVVSQIF